MLLVFLDPRFRSQLDGQQITSAKITIIAIWDKIEKLEEASALNANIGENLRASDNEDDILEKHLREINDTPSIDRSELNLQNLLKEINEFDTEKRLPTNFSVLQFWEENKAKYSYLFKVAEVVHGIPPTQVPVERSFSILALIYNSRRVQLRQQMLENPIHIKLNKDMAYQIFEKDVNEIENPSLD